MKNAQKAIRMRWKKQGATYWIFSTVITPQTSTASQVEDWFQKYGVDGIDAVMCTDDDASMGAIQAIKQNNATDKIKVCSFNGFQVAIQQIEQGNMEMTIAQQPYKMGYDSVMCGVGALKGETYERQIPVDVEIIDASNYEGLQGIIIS